MKGVLRTSRYAAGEMYETELDNLCPILPLLIAYAAVQIRGVSQRQTDEPLASAELDAVFRKTCPPWLRTSCPPGREDAQPTSRRVEGRHLAGRYGKELKIPRRVRARCDKVALYQASPERRASGPRVACEGRRRSVADSAGRS